MKQHLIGQGGNTHSSKPNKQSTTIWDFDFFDYRNANTLRGLLQGLLRELKEKLTARDVALYKLEQGQLSLLISFGNTDLFDREVPYFALKKKFQAEMVPDRDLIIRSFLKTSPPAGIVLLPLRSEGKVRGAIVAVHYDRESCVPALTDSIRLAMMNVSTLVSYIQSINKELLRSSHLGLINRIIRSTDVLMEEDEVYRQVAEQIQRSFKYDLVSIYLLHTEKRILGLRAIAGKFGQRVPKNQTVPLGQGIVSWVASHDESLLSNNVHRNPFFLNYTPDLITTESELCVPIHLDKQVIGVLNIEHSEPLYFDQDDINSLEILADRIGVAIQNSRLYSELKRSYNHLQEIVSSMGQGLLMVDRDLNIIWANEMVKKWGVRDHHGQFLPSFFDKRSQVVMANLVQRTLNDGTIRREQLKGNDDKYFTIVTAPMLDGERSSPNSLVVIDDVSAQFLSRAELERTKQELEKAQRLRALGEFASVLAHEIRNPLNAMVQAADSLEASVRFTPPQRKLLDILKEEGRRLEDILNSYLQKANPPKLRFAFWDLRVIVEEVAALLEADQLLMNRISLNISIGKSIPPLSLDANSIRQLLLNLLLNAVDSIEDRGEVNVEVRKENECIVLQIADDGCGISADSLQYIYEPFFTTKEKGSGLGLAVVKRIVEEHDWTIGVESTESLGTKFTLKIPIAPEID